MADMWRKPLCQPYAPLCRSPELLHVFSVWDENNICQSWDDTACRPGDLVRVAEQFPYGSFRKSVAKYVREDEGGGKEPYARHGGRLIGLSGWACSPPSGAGPRPAAASQAARTGFHRKEEHTSQ